MLAAREQILRGVQARVNAVLMRRQAEHRLELPHEVERRDLHLASKRLDRRRGLAHLTQQIARPTESPETFVSQQHRCYLVCIVSATLMKQPLTCRALMTVFLLCATVAGAQASGSGSVCITSPSGFTQNLDTLSNSASPSNVLPTGWYLIELGSGGAADGSYVVGTGSSNAGGAYSFGA